MDIASMQCWHLFLPEALSETTLQKHQKHIQQSMTSVQYKLNFNILEIYSNHIDTY